MAEETEELTTSEMDEKYIEAARDIHGSDGECEIDEGATVSYSDDGGAYVAAWVWVSEMQDAGVASVRFIEETGRKCYRSEGIGDGESYKQFLKSHTLTSFHTSMLRFSCVVVDFMVDRGVAQEITRHGKTLDFQHESQRYCCYSKDKFGNSVGFIKPRGLNIQQEEIWTQSMKEAEYSYFCLLKTKLKPEIAADCLPRATASLLTAVGDFQAWRHFLLSRTTVQCHPKMLNVTADSAEGEDLSESTNLVRMSLLDQFKLVFPVLFDDIEPYGQYPENMRKPR